MRASWTVWANALPPWWSQFDALPSTEVPLQLWRCVEMPWAVEPPDVQLPPAALPWNDM